MLYGKLLSIFLQGLAVGAGPCVLTCAPILLPFIAGTSRDWKEGLKAALAFGLARLAVYTLMGGVVGYIGYYMFQLFYSQLWGFLLWILAGIFLVISGILIIFGKGMENPLCTIVQKHKIKSVVFLGLIVALLPCFPLLAVLTEIMFLSQDIYQGLIYGFAFGVGTVISPLLLLGAAAPLIPGRSKYPKIFNVICGSLLVIVGVWIIIARVVQVFRPA